MIYRPRWRAPDGSEREGRAWWLDVTVAGRRHRRSLGVRGSHAAQALATGIVRRLELQAAGLPVPDAQEDLSPRALVREFEDELVRRRSAQQHVRRTVQRLESLFEGHAHLAEVTAPMLRRALGRLGRTGLSPQTVNAYRVAAHSFFAWLVEEGRWAANPAAQVRRERPAEPARRRRSLSQEELARLVAASLPHRAAAYLLAATAGLRRSELAALAWGDLDLGEGTVRVRAPTSKNRREALLPLPEGTVAALRATEGPSQLPTARVLAGVPSTRTLRRYLATAGVLYEAADGVVDLHALRVTYATLLARAGVALAQAQRLMRHSTPALTSNTYTRVDLADTRGAVARLEAHPPGRTGRRAGG